MADRHLRLVTTTTSEPQSCYGCTNGMFGPRGTYCHAFGEVILDEVASAEDCPEYEELSDD